MWQIRELWDSLQWPSPSFAILIASLALAGLILWRRYRSRRGLLVRIAELEALSGAGRAIVASRLNVVALCDLIAQESGKVIDNKTFQVGLFEDGCYVLQYWTIEGVRQETPRRFDLEDNPGIVGWVRDNKQPLLIRDFLEELDTLPARPRYVSQTPARSSIFIPLISGDDVIGILAAQSRQPDRFNDEDMRRLMILANQAAAAIAQAQLFEDAQRRASHLRLVGNIAHEVNTVQDPEEIFTQVVFRIRETFGFHPVSIYGLERESMKLTVQASSGPWMLDRRLCLEVGQGITGSAAAARKSIVSNNTGEDRRFIPSFPGFPETRVDTQAEVAIPLIVNDEVLGVLDVQSSERGAFGAAEVTALEVLAAEVAVATDKARQLAQQREQAWITTARLQIAEAIDRNEELDEMINAVVRLTLMFVGLDFCGVLLWDEEIEKYRGAVIYGPDRVTCDCFNDISLTIGEWSPLDAVHVGKESLTTSKWPPWVSAPKASQRTDDDQVMLLPIVARERMLGVMATSPLTRQSAEQPAGHATTMLQRQELLENIIRQLAQAMDSALSRMARQEEAWVNTALLQVAEAVNSLIDLNEILNTIVRLVPMLVGVRSVIVLIWDEHNRLYRAGPSHGISEMGRGLLETLELAESEFLLSVSKHPAEYLAPSAVYYSLQLAPWLAKVLGTNGAHAFPLHARGRRVGVMLVGSSPGSDRALSARRLSILNGISHQAATAVVNDQLYKESAERNRLEQELGVARGIQTSLIPSGSPAIPGCSVAGYWQAARQVSGDFYDFLQLSDGCWSIAIADVADKGIPAALFMALSRTILRTVAFSRSDPADVLRRTNQIINSDTHSDLFVTVFYAVWDPKSSTLTYANGGHNPPLLLRKNGRSRLLRSQGMALGVLPEIQVKSGTVRVSHGDIVVFYTDGVTEAINEDYDEFGMDRLHLATSSARGQDANGIMRQITSAISLHAGGTPQFDDVTLVVMKREDSENNS